MCALPACTAASKTSTNSRRSWTKCAADLSEAACEKPLLHARPPHRVHCHLPRIGATCGVVADRERAGLESAREQPGLAARRVRDITVDVLVRADVKPCGRGALDGDDVLVPLAQP